MRKYELMTIAKITLGEDGARALSNSIKDLISSNKGKTLNSDFWGKRKFAYEIKHDQEAFYEVIELEMDPLSITTLKTKLNLEENLVRYIISATE
ncbi:30S ribosomal protein S6 [candidate division WWE3 bacterium]|jgi:small subunit ribosomal protein S6|nr:30S ribosomal protein S6 [candidate division WWE3 bacterium]MBT7350725.1 30S ribosomal protein S6 [candidate division WWE3 bacterium]